MLFERMRFVSAEVAVEELDDAVPLVATRVEPLKLFFSSRGLDFSCFGGLLVEDAGCGSFLGGNFCKGGLV